MYHLTFNVLCRHSLTFLFAFFTHMGIPVEIALRSVSCRSNTENRSCRFILPSVIWNWRIFRGCVQTPCSESVFQYFALLGMFLGVDLEAIHAQPPAKTPWIPQTQLQCIPLATKPVLLKSPRQDFFPQKTFSKRCKLLEWSVKHCL